MLRVGRGSVPDPTKFLHKKIRVGSIHTNLNYDLSERATHRSEVPAPALAAHAAKAEMKAKDAKRWHGETSTFREYSERLSMQNFVMDPTEYSFNHRAEELPKSRPVLVDSFGTLKKVYFNTHFNRTAEMPVSSALEGKVGWNLSTQVPYAERVRMQEAKDALHRVASARATATMTASMGGRGYEGLKAREDRRCREVREAREAEVERATDPFALERMRAEKLQWTASVRDTVTRGETISPATRSSALTSLGGGAPSPFLSFQPQQQQGGGGGGAALTKEPSNLEKKYLSLVNQSSVGLRTGTQSEKALKTTRWCYGP